MGAWVALLGPERSADDLAKVRASSAERFNIDKFSCDDCSASKTCEWAFDPYNTDGDCLAEK